MPNAAPHHPQRARLAIWSPGTYRSLSGDEFTFTDGDLSAIAAGYSPALFAAPMVKGHPKTDDPAHGWADALEWDGRYLWADVAKLDPAFADEWRAGRWGKVSPRFFLPGEPGNPTPGHYYLRHIGMLGAAAPANKTLPMAEFAEGDGTVTFVEALPELPAAEFGESQRWGFAALGDLARRFREWLIADKGLEAADQLVPEHLISTLRSASEAEASPVPAFSAPQPQEPAMPDPVTPTPEQQAAFAEQQAALEAREAEIAAREQAVAQRQAEARRADCAAFAQQLVDNNQIVPAEQDFVTALLFEIGDDAQVSFAEGDQQVTVATGHRLRDFLARNLPQQVPYGEDGASAAEGDGSPAFAAPAGYQVDRGREELHRKALAYQQQHGCDYATAASAVGA